MYFHIFDNLLPPERRFRASKIIIITYFVVVSSDDIIRFVLKEVLVQGQKDSKVQVHVEFYGIKLTYAYFDDFEG